MKTVFLILLVAISSSTIKNLPADMEYADSTTKTNNNSPGILYYGNWSEANDPSCFENDRHISQNPYANCYFMFNKNIVRWVGSKGNNHGFADVYIDGVFQKTIDTYSDELLSRQVLFEKKGLSDDRIHTINIIVKKEKNAKSSGYYQDIDYFESLEPVNYLEWYEEAADSEMENIISGTRSYLAPDSWEPVLNKANVPVSGVLLQAGVVNDCFVKNISYLKHCFNNPNYCDGIGWAEFLPGGWTTWLPGSNEGRMLQGAGNTLRWGERSDMRDIINTIVNKIESRQRADGYSNYYPESDSYAIMRSSEDPINSERKNYDRVFWTRGLLDAGRSGDPRAYDALRNFYDWFNDCSYLGTMLNGSNSTNGLPGGGLTYFSPVGKSQDLVITERYFDQDHWINELKNENPLCITYYQTTNPHCYELLGLEAFIDEYRATGAEKYIDAVKGGWNVYHENFRHIGGITAICEGRLYPPKSYYLNYKFHTGETCGSVFWININSKLLQLYPTEERYASEIEQGIYNTLLACQDSKGYIRYHNFLFGNKDRGRCDNSCCECSSVGMMAKLPEYIYSIDNDGIYVNLFTASTISWQQNNENATLVMNTEFPKNNAVSILFKGSSSIKMKVRIRIPSWAESDVHIDINKGDEIIGKPGTYVTIDRIWNEDDVIGFQLPISFSLHKYTGLDQDEESNKYALMYGPVLMSLVGGETLNIPKEELPEKLESIFNAPLVFNITGMPDCKYMPYYQVQDEKFTCYPTME